MADNKLPVQNNDGSYLKNVVSLQNQSSDRRIWLIDSSTGFLRIIDPVDMDEEQVKKIPALRNIILYGLSSINILKGGEPEAEEASGSVEDPNPDIPMTIQTPMQQMIRAKDPLLDGAPENNPGCFCQLFGFFRLVKEFCFQNGVFIASVRKVE